MATDIEILKVEDIALSPGVAALLVPASAVGRTRFVRVQNVGNQPIEIHTTETGPYVSRLTKEGEVGSILEINYISGRSYLPIWGTAAVGNTTARVFVAREIQT